MGKGITKETRTKSAKLFKPTMDLYNGLCLAKLADVQLEEYEVKDTDSNESFRGLKAPRLTLHFVEVGGEGDPANYWHTWFAVDQAKESRLVELAESSMFSQMKHILEELKGAELTDEEYAKLQLGLEEGKVYSGEEVLAEYKEFFRKYMILVKEHLNKKVWLKLLRYNYYNGKLNPVARGNNVGFPTFVGSGFIELYKEGVNPGLKIEVHKGESIEEINITQVATTPQTATASQDNLPSFMKD